jgi:hypothetical protein
MQFWIRDVAAREFPNARSIQFFRSLGIRSVVVIKRDIGFSSQRDVLSRSTAGLPITRKETSDAVIFTLPAKR